MSRIFELLDECASCGRHSFGGVVLHLWNEDRRLRFCRISCKVRWLDTHPSEMGDSDPRFENVDTPAPQPTRGPSADDTQPEGEHHDN